MLKGTPLFTGQWSGLKHLPTASNKDFANSSQTDIIKQKRSKLDKALANLPEPDLVTASEVAAAAEQVSETQPTADQFASQAGVDDEKDEDLVRDLNRVRSQKQPLPGQQEPSSQSKHLFSVSCKVVCSFPSLGPGCMLCALLPRPIGSALKFTPLC